MKKSTSMKDYMYSRAKVGAPKGNLGGEPDAPKKYDVSEIKGKGLQKTEREPTEAEIDMSNRKYASSPDSEDMSPLERNYKTSLRKDIEKKNSDLKNAVEISRLKSENARMKNREGQMGGSKAVTRKIERRKKVREFVKASKTGAAITAGGLAATFFGGK